jgi:uncharacterized protein VirK/YbjX
MIISSAQESKFSAILTKRYRIFIRFFSKYLNFNRHENEHVSTFLENFETVAQKHEQRRQKIKKDVK